MSAREPLALMAALAAVLVWSGASPRDRFTWWLVTCVCLAVSAFYELIEWWAALLTGEGATAFLGTQGDPWDTQWDMFLALVGVLTSQVLLGGAHERQLRRVAGV